MHTIILNNSMSNNIMEKEIEVNSDSRDDNGRHYGLVATNRSGPSLLVCTESGDYEFYRSEFGHDSVLKKIDNAEARDMYENATLPIQIEINF